MYTLSTSLHHFIPRIKAPEVTTYICSHACIVTQNNIIACNKFSLKARESHFVDLLRSRPFERVARQWARSVIVWAPSGKHEWAKVRAGSYHTRPENHANDFDFHFDVQLPSKYNKSGGNQTVRNFFCINRPFALVDHVINFRQTQKQFTFETFC